MNVAGQFIVQAPQQAVYECLRDPKSFAQFLDGISDLKEIGPDRYSAVFETRIAYLRFRFNVTVEVLRMEAPHRIDAKMEGVPLGIVGRLTANSVATLEEDGGATRVRYSVESALAGKLGSLGQPVLRAKAKEMEAAFAKRLSAHFAMVA